MLWAPWKSQHLFFCVSSVSFNSIRILICRFWSATSSACVFRSVFINTLYLRFFLFVLNVCTVVVVTGQQFINIILLIIWSIIHIILIFNRNRGEISIRFSKIITLWIFFMWFESITTANSNMCKWCNDYTIILKSSFLWDFVFHSL